MEGPGVSGSRSAVLHRYTTYQEFVAAMMLVYSMNASPLGHRIDTLYLPYLPGARQDKPRNVSTSLPSTGDILHSMDFTLSLIEMSGGSKVHTLDIHNPNALVGKSSKVNVINHDISDYKTFNAFEYDGIIAPDAGATDRALSFAKKTRLPLFLGRKKRDPQTNKLSGFSVEGLRSGDNYLVVDDICDGGGTFVGLYDEAIAPVGATADLFVTHGLFTKGEARSKLFFRYGKVQTTDSLGYTADNVHVSPVVPRMISGSTLITDQKYTFVHNSISEGKR